MTQDVHARMDQLLDRIAHLEGVIERMHRPGTVTDVDYSDATKPRARIHIGTDEDGQPVKGPWVPVASFAGGRTIHAPVTVGQQMMHVSPDGNFENGFLHPYSFSKQIPSPSTKKDEHVDAYGDVKTTLKTDSHMRQIGKLKITHSKDSVAFDLDGTTLTMSKDGFTFKGGKIMHDDLNIGSSHVHDGVEPGNADTGVPQA